MKKTTILLASIALMLLAVPLYAQPIAVNNITQNFTFGSYGRIGASWTPENLSSIGRRLNLNNMGSIGGRMEEQDYLEFAAGYHMKPVVAGDSVQINIQLRTSVYSRSLSLFGRSSTSSAGGLTIALPEMYLEAKDIFRKGLNMWIGARLYRGPDLHMADYWYFNDHSGQGFGIEYKKNRFHMNFVSETDTSSNVPPYFYVNIKTGTPSLELRERVVMTYERDITPNKDNLITLLGEFHRLSDPGQTNIGDTLVIDYPADFGWVLGARHQRTLNGFLPGSFNHFSVRYGKRIANGGDGGNSQTFLTFGAPDFDTDDFERAYSWHIVEQVLLNLTKKFSLNAYGIYNQSRGAAPTKGESETYFGRKVFNYKEDLTFGVKGVNYISDYFHWQTELHYSQRKDGEQDWYRMWKLSLVPTVAVRGERSVWSRPHLRFIYSLARYNDLARDNLYSPYLGLVGAEKWGHYFGVRAEWWTW
ncbi:carbohydrate porin [Flammeovirgaceae bacterium SG7u.111]|nr:carbohydrate porin [Flammeovirgaceae bacterium SG7u.132]WPO33248.1 carbohydrate porin [Flammeovirgaceae bacterium SG7u.111]